MVNVYPQAIIDAALRAARSNLEWDSRYSVQREPCRLGLRSHCLEGMTTAAALRLLRAQCPDRMTEAPPRRRGAMVSFYFSAEVTRAFYEMARS